MPSLPELVTSVEDVSGLPATFIKVSKTLDDPECSSKDLAAIIEKDPALTVKLLRLANSAFYGFRGRVDTVARAISIIGFKELKSVVLTISVRSIFEGFGKDGPIDMNRFWEHSMACGITCRVLASLKGKQNTESYFIAGFLHDIGRLILLEYLPQQYLEVQDMAQTDERLVHELEELVFGYNHAEVGGELVRTWGLPAPLFEAVTHHHDPSKCENFIESTSLVHISDIVVHAFRLGASGNPLVPPLNRGAWLLSGLTKDMLEPAAENINKQFEDAGVIFAE
ncbi:HDOD domain-containing protein [bacterium]|nr:HDOD domain-containing protein [bacterium]